jgi:Ala-tRNA(Pro) deacylase
MGSSKKLTEFLKKQKIKHKVLIHPLAYTAQEVAASQHIPGKQFVKSVVVKAGPKYVLAVLPAIHLIHFPKLKKLIKSKSASLASESEIKRIAQGFDVGALPPFGSLLGLETYMDSVLNEDEVIVFNAGTHTETAKIKMADFLKVEKVITGEFGKHI